MIGNDRFANHVIYFNLPREAKVTKVEKQNFMGTIAAKRNKI